MAGPGKIRVASISYVPAKWDKESNLRKIEKGLISAKRRRARIAVFCEGMLDGYVVNEVKRRDEKRFFELGEEIPGGFYARAISAAVKKRGLYAVVGMLERAGDVLYNSAVLFDPRGRVQGIYRKTHFWQGYSGADPDFYKPGSDLPVFRTALGRIGIMICFDRQIPEVSRALCLQGAGIILVPSYGGYGQKNTCTMRSRAIENGVAHVFSHPKKSLIINDEGDVLAECGKNDLACASVEIRREKSDFWKSRRRPEVFEKFI